MSWFIWMLIIGGLFVALNAFSPAVRAITFSFFCSIWAGIKWFGRKIGVPAILVLIGTLSLIFTFYLLLFWIGYQSNSNALLQPLMVFNFVMLLLTATVFKSTRLALLFMFLCNITLFCYADVVLFKAHITAIAGFTLFCLFFVAAGIYFEKITKFPGTFMSIIFVATFLFNGYTHIEKDRWEAWRNQYLAKRGIQVVNTNSRTATLNNDWKFAIVKPRYKIIVTDHDGRVVKPNYPIIENEKVLIYAAPNPTIPIAVDKTFRGLPVYRIGDPTFADTTTYWILQANIKLLTNPDEGVVVSKAESPSLTDTLVFCVNSTNWDSVLVADPGDVLFVYNAGQDTVLSRWGRWSRTYPPGEWKSDNFFNFQPGKYVEVKNKNGNLGESVLTVIVIRKEFKAVAFNHRFLF